MIVLQALRHEAGLLGNSEIANCVQFNLDSKRHRPLAVIFHLRRCNFSESPAVSESELHSTE